MASEDLQEEDVWGSMEASKPFSSSSSSTNLACTPRKEVNPSKECSKRSSSAPVKIPNGKMMMMMNDGHDVDDDGVHDDGIVPPHEHISRRLARTQILSFSVCEGVGRKLKGRDLSEVRNGVLRKTGFLE